MSQLRHARPLIVAADVLVGAARGDSGGGGVGASSGLTYPWLGALGGELTRSASRDGGFTLHLTAT